jgi:hypothetical protein
MIFAQYPLIAFLVKQLKSLNTVAQEGLSDIKTGLVLGGKE